MAYWVYKNNSRNAPHQVSSGDWAVFFQNNKADEWGSTEWIADVLRLAPGDHVLAYQTDRNELVGLAKVVRLGRRGRYRDAILKPVEVIGAKVRPLKADPRIRDIPALQGGPIHSIYDITKSDALALIAAARASATGATKPQSSKAPSRQIVTEVTGVLAELPANKRRELIRQLRVLVRDARLRPFVLRAWGHACTACGMSLETRTGDAECEVAHVVPVTGKGHDQVANAIPLCRTHHWAFDRHLWAIDPTTRRIVVVRKWRKHPALRKIHQRKVAHPSRANWPTFANVRRRWKAFQSAHRT